MNDLHFYSTEEYQLKRVEFIIKNLTTPVEKFNPFSQSPVIKNYIYYEKPVKL